MKEIERSAKYSEEQIKHLRKALAKHLRDRDFAVVVSGSFARREASAQSDLDYFFICDNKRSEEELKKKLPAIQRVVQRIVKKPPAAGGAFEQIDTIDNMEQNIGGQQDSNDKITRRILFLLEGEWLYNQTKFDEYRKRIVSKYIKSTISEHQLGRFFLNDLIRYYRTICVDFEYKTVEDRKTWGLRNVKLMFSRKLLYFSGIIVAAESAQLSADGKVQRTLGLLAQHPIRRVQEVCGTRADDALKIYSEFLEAISDASRRKAWERVTVNRNTHVSDFRRIKNRGHHFTWALARLIKETYDSSHPIHNALIM